jgi:hypothetical protein
MSRNCASYSGVISASPSSSSFPRSHAARACRPAGVSGKNCSGSVGYFAARPTRHFTRWKRSRSKARAVRLSDSALRRAAVSLSLRIWLRSTNVASLSDSANVARRAFS